jgi:hypothetical protein
MPPRSKVAMLPEAVRAELERRIVERSFSRYQDLADWLQAQGYRIAADSVQRHGARLARKIETAQRVADAAGAIAAATDGTVDVASRLIHQRILALLLDEPGLGEECSSTGVSEPASDSPRAQPLTLADLARITRILADLNRITLSRQHQIEPVRAHPRQPTRDGEATHAERRGKGLSEEAYHAIRSALLGIDPFDPEQREGSSDAGIRAATPERHEPAGDAGSDETADDARPPQARLANRIAGASSSPAPLLETSEGAQTQLSAYSRRTPQKTSIVPSTG